METRTPGSDALSMSARALERACKSLAGGDSSTMRVQPYQIPLVADRGAGARLWDVDGNEYIDLNMAYGPLILGHRPARVVEAVVAQVSERGSQLGFPTEIGARVAEKIKLLFPGMELMRFANSGTEALMSAVRLARAVTGRPKIVLFEGHYHGWGEATFHRYHAELSALPDGPYGPAIPGTAGMSRSIEDALVARWNDLEALERVLSDHEGQVAGVVMEPVMGNAGVIPPAPGYLLGARDLVHRHGALLVFDEVITGMRVAAGGAQEHYDIEADVTVISKALGGGYPVAAFGASRELMAPIVEGSLFHGGVFSGNALVMAAAEAVLDEVVESRHTMYKLLHETADALAQGLREIMTRLRVPHVVQNVGPMLSLYLTEEPTDRIADYRDARRMGRFERYIEFQHAAQRAGVFMHPNMLEPMFLSTAHTLEDVEEVLDRLERAAAATLAR